MDLAALRGLALPLAMSTLVSATSLFFNGALDAAQSAVADDARDWATSLQAIEMVALALVARHIPRAIRARRIGAACLAALVLGAALAGWGTLNANPVALTVGACLSSTCVAWTTLVWVASCSLLPFRQMFACIALGDLLATPLAAVLSRGGYLFSLCCYALALAVPLLWCAHRAAGLFDAFSRAEPAADAEVTRPSSVLPLTHDLFIYILAFFTAYGFALRYQQADGSLLGSWFIALVLAGVVVWGLARTGGPRVDALFTAAFALLLGGFLLALIGDDALALPASVALACSSSVFGLLMTLALGAVAARSPATAVPALAWGHAAHYAGIELGAQLGIFVTSVSVGHQTLAQGCVAAVLAAVVLYTVLSIRDFGFDKTIAGIDPGRQPAVVVEVQYTDRIDARCDELARKLGLTDRETDVFRLLIRGNNTLRIQEELSITKNTLKYHARHIYEKAGVHSQQELIDLV